MIIQKSILLVLIATGSSKQLMDIINMNNPMECSHTSVPTQVVMHLSSFHLDLKHEKKHTGQGLFPCLHCNGKYTTNGAMKAHLKTHTDEKIQCPKCPILFKTKAEYNQHKRGCHGKEHTLPCGEKNNGLGRFLHTNKNVVHARIYSLKEIKS